MTTNHKWATIASFTCLNICAAICDPSTPGPLKTLEAGVPNVAAEGLNETELRANKRYEEMLTKMQSAVEEIAQLYGNPVFLQIFTNDAGQASELKDRLRIAQKAEEIRNELNDLERRREGLLEDIALRQRETKKLSEKLIRQRRALDALADAVEQAKEAVEDTAK
jgi:hypothetical protein